MRPLLLPILSAASRPRASSSQTSSTPRGGWDDIDEDEIPDLIIPETLTVSWPTIPGKQYTLLYSPDLSSGSWQPVEAPFVANGGISEFVFIMPGADKLFYRVGVSDIDEDGDGFSNYEELLDSDADGLSDWLEIENGFDPYNPDQNNNGIPDSQDDNDGDGVPNATEMGDGSNPNNGNDFAPQIIEISKSVSGSSNITPYEPPNDPYSGQYRLSSTWIDTGSSFQVVHDAAIDPGYLAPILESVAFPATPPAGVEATKLSLANIYSRSWVNYPPEARGMGTELQANRVWLKVPASANEQRFLFIKAKDNTIHSHATNSNSREFISAEVIEMVVPANQNLSQPIDLAHVPAPVAGCDLTSFTRLVPVEFEIIHAEIDPATGQPVNPRANTMLRDEIVNIRIKVPPIGITDWTVDLSVEPEAMHTQSLPNRGTVQMYDFGQIEANGTVMSDKTQFVLQASAGGERTIRAVFNKEGVLKIKMKSTDGKIDFTSPEYTIQKRIRKYANLPSSQNHDLNQHDQAFIDAAAHWCGVYQHPVDDVERLKAMGMAESELGLTDATDIMTVGNPGDHVLDTFRNVPPYDRFPGVAPLGGLALREVDIANNTTKMLSYPAADETPAATAIHWGVCWFYQKASSIQNNPNPPQPPNPPNPYIPGPWRSWDTATERYNGGGVPDYLQRINRSMKEGRHPSNANLYIWPLKSNKKARGNQ